MKNFIKIGVVVLFSTFLLCSCKGEKIEDTSSVLETTTTPVTVECSTVEMNVSRFKTSETIKEVQIVTKNSSNSNNDSNSNGNDSSNKENNTFFTPQLITKSTSITTPQTTTTTKKVTKNMNTTTSKTVVTTSQPIVTTTRPAAQSNYSIINYIPTAQEWDMFCTVVSSETGYCSETIQKHVAHTVINRVKHMLNNSNSPFPKTLYGILTQQGQYTCISNYFYGTYRSGMAPGSAGWNNTMRIIKEAWNEPDPINGSIGYYNPNMGGLNYWFENNLQFCYQDSVARYFRLK